MQNMQNQSRCNTKIARNRVEWNPLRTASSSVELGSPVKYRIETSISAGSPGRIRTYSQPPPVGSATWISWQRLARAVASLRGEFQMANFRYRSAFQLGIAYTESPVPPSSRVEVAQAGRVKTMALTLA